MKIKSITLKNFRGIQDLNLSLNEKSTVIFGVNGVGKSSILNALHPSADMETGEVSQKTERGRHTTRHSELIAISEGTYIMDTPGFSSLSLFDISKEELQSYYPEFAPFENQCKFMTCTHIHEPVCGIRTALEAEKVSKIRYDNYTAFYEELKEKERRKY